MAGEFWRERPDSKTCVWQPKRSVEYFGVPFKLSDCRVWMRLHFWALRQSSIWQRSPRFVAFYTKFIAHFVSIYEQTAPVFTRESGVPGCVGVGTVGACVSGCCNACCVRPSGQAS